MNAKQWRKSKKLTLKALAEKIGCVNSYVSEVENGVKPPSGKILRAYYKLSNGQVTPSDFKLTD
jgi:transcriptional regulator with XRE-family HTH domain